MATVRQLDGWAWRIIQQMMIGIRFWLEWLSDMYALYQANCISETAGCPNCTQMGKDNNEYTPSAGRFTASQVACASRFSSKQTRRSASIKEGNRQNAGTRGSATDIRLEQSAVAPP